jgi:trimeric autotransporter adhesin
MKRMSGRLTQSFLLALAFQSTALSPLAAADPPVPGTIHTIAGIGSYGDSGDDGPATLAELNGPHGLAFDAVGNLYISDQLNHRVRKIGADGNIRTVAGTGQPGFSGDGRPALQARMNGANFLAFGRDGNLFVSDTANTRVRRISSDGTITTVAGRGGPQFQASSGDGGPAIDARFSDPLSIAVDATGVLYVADWVANRVRRVDRDGIVTTVARVNSPTGVAVDAAGNLFIAQPSNHRVVKMALDGTLTTVAGTGKGGFSGDSGLAVGATLNTPFQVTVDSAGNLFIADWGNYRVRKVDANGVITTVAGNGESEYSGEGGPATQAGLRGPSGLAIDARGNLYLTDSEFLREDGLNSPSERVLVVYGAAAPGLLAGMPLAAQP